MPQYSSANATALIPDSKNPPLPTAQSALSVAGLGAFLLFLVACPSLFSKFWPADYDFWPQSLFLLMTAGTAVLVALSGHGGPRLGAVSNLLLGFLAWTLLSVATSVYLHDSMLEYFRVASALTWFFVTRAVWKPERALLIVLALCSGMAWVCAPAIWHFVHDPDHQRQFGTYYNPNLFANAIAMTLPYAAVLPLMVWRKRSGFLLVCAASVPFLLLGPGLATTASKGGLLAAGAGLLLCLAGMLHAKRGAAGDLFKVYWPFVLAILLVCGLGGGLLGSKTLLPRLQATFGKEDNSTMFRVYTWKGTLRMARSRPVVGYGPDTFPTVFSRFATAGFTRSAHQSWLQIASESGFPALVLLAGTCVMAGVAGWKGLQGKEWPLAAAGLGSLVAFALHGLTDSGWSIPSIVFSLAVTLAILSRIEVDHRMLGEIVADHGPDARHGGLSYPWIGVALVLAGGGYLTQRAMEGETASEDASALMHQGRLADGLAAARDAVAQDPQSARLWLRLGNAQAACGQNPLDSLREAIRLQPDRAGNWMQLARAFGAEGAGKTAAAMDRAIELDPNDTSQRLERATWRLDHHDSGGYEDLKYIVGLLQKPYGLYPATPDWVNLDFARATVLLVPRLRQEKAPALAIEELLKAGLKDIKTERENLPTQKEMLAAGTESALPPPPEDLDILEADLRRLQATSQP